MAAKRPAKPRKQPSITLVQSDKKDVRVPVKAGMRFEVCEVAVVDADFKKPRKLAARLCGLGSNTCLAMVELKE